MKVIKYKPRPLSEEKWGNKVWWRLLRPESGDPGFIYQVIYRLRNDVIVERQHDDWLNALAEGIEWALRGHNYARASESVDKLIAWWREDPIGHAWLADTIQMLELFCWWRQRWQGRLEIRQ